MLAVCSVQLTVRFRLRANSLIHEVMGGWKILFCPWRNNRKLDSASLDKLEANGLVGLTRWNEPRFWNELS